MKVTIEISPETLVKLDPALIQTNRTLRNYVESVVIAIANRQGTILDLDKIGKLYPLK